MSTDPAPRITARQRLAQTRAEIIDAIVPGLEPAAAAPTSARAARAAAYEAAEQRALHEQLEAQRRTAAQREAVADWVADRASGASPSSAAAAAAASAPRSGRRAAAAASGFGWRPLLRRGASIWWRHHPAHAAVEVLDSALSHVAYRKPYLMLGVAAGAGALLVVVRPWRLVSLTGLALAFVKTTDMRSLMGSLLRGD